MPIEDKDELIRLVENGWRLYYDQRHDRFRAYDPSTKKMIRVSRSLNDVAKQLYKEIKKKKRSKDLRIEKVDTDDTIGVKDVLKSSANIMVRSQGSLLKEPIGMLRLC
jgi:hypothetical protein